MALADANRTRLGLNSLPTEQHRARVAISLLVLAGKNKTQLFFVRDDHSIPLHFSNKALYNASAVHRTNHVPVDNAVSFLHLKTGQRKIYVNVHKYNCHKYGNSILELILFVGLLCEGYCKELVESPKLCGFARNYKWNNTERCVQHNITFIGNITRTNSNFSYASHYKSDIAYI